MNQPLNHEPKINYSILGQNRPQVLLIPSGESRYFGHLRRQFGLDLRRRSFIIDLHHPVATDSLHPR